MYILEHIYLKKYIVITILLKSPQTEIMHAFFLKSDLHVC